MGVNYQRILLPLPAGCIQGRFAARVKRFSVKIETASGAVWAHTNNTGSMLGLLAPGAPALLSPAANPCRKLQWTLERIWLGDAGRGFWAGVNTLSPNRMLKAAFMAGLLDFAKGYETLQMERKNGASRLDGCFTGADKPPLWVECKNVSLVEDEVAAFPDAVSERALKHLLELVEIVKRGERAAMFFLVQRPDARCFSPADYIDEKYAESFYRALGQGVEAYAYEAALYPAGMGLGRRLKVTGSMGKYG